MNDDLNFYKKNDYLVKNNLIPQELLNRINKIVKEVITKEKRKKNNIKNQVTTQKYDNYHFVYNSSKLENKEILRLNNPQNRHRIFYDLSRNKKIITVVKKLVLITSY